MRTFPKLASAFLLVFFLFLNFLIGQSQQQRLMLLPGTYSLIGNSIKLNSACVDPDRGTPNLNPSDIHVIRQGDVKIKIEGLSAVLTLGDALAQGLLAFNKIEGYETVSISSTAKTKNKRIDIEISKGAIIGESAQDQGNLNEALFEIDWRKRENVQDGVWSIQDGYIDRYSENELLNKLEIEALISKKQYNEAFDKVKVAEDLTNYLRRLDYGYFDNSFLNKAEIKSLLEKKLYNTALAKFQNAEVLQESLDELSYYYESKLLNKIEIETLLTKKQYDIASAKIKTAKTIHHYKENLEEYQSYGLIVKGEIEALIGKKQFDLVIARFKSVEALFEVMPSIDECFEYKLLDKAEIQALLIKKQYDVALSKFESIESLYEAMPSIDECYEYKLLDKTEIEALLIKKEYDVALSKFKSVEELLALIPFANQYYSYKLLDKAEIEALISNKQFDQVQAKFKEKSQFYQTYEDTKYNRDNYHALGLVTNEARASLLTDGKHAELVERLTQSDQKYREIVNQSPVLRLNEYRSLIKYNESYFDVRKYYFWSDISVSKFEFDYAKLNRDQDDFWSDLVRYARVNDDKPAYLYPGVFNATASSANLRILGQEPIEIKASPEQVFDAVLQKSIDYISSQPEDKPIFIAKDNWANSSEFGQFPEGVKIKKMADSDAQMMNSTELYVQLKKKFPNRRNIYLGGNIEKDMEFLDNQKEVSPLVQGVHDVVIYKSPSQFKVEQEPLTPAIVGQIQANNLTVLDLNQYQTINDLPKNLEATKAVVVTGHNNEELVAYLTWLAENGFLKGKYVYALTCYEDYSTPVLTEILNKGGARSLNFFSTKLNKDAVGKVLIELPKLLASAPAESEKKELLQWIEFAAGKLKKEDLSPFLQQQYGKILDGVGVQMTSEK